MYHVLPHLAIAGAPGEWVATYELLLDRGLSPAEALTQIAFAYTGSLHGELPEELQHERHQRPDGRDASDLAVTAGLDS